jgi:nitrate reductase delta subunit
MNRRFAILSALLRYPDQALRHDLPDIVRAIPAAGFPPASARAMLRLARRLAAGDPLDRQEEYVNLFDRGRSTSLHIFEHVHGDTRNRGPAMIDLARAYQAAGYALAANELPDYLPLFLEFLAVAPEATAADMLAGAAPILDALHARLMGRGRPAARGYAAVLAAALAEIDLAPRTRATEAQEQSDEHDLAAIDAAYRDEPVVFGPEANPQGSGACGKVATIIERMRAASAPAAAR